jgi:hypothetical protein
MRPEEDHLRLRRYRIRQQTPSTIDNLRRVHSHDATVTRADHWFPACYSRRVTLTGERAPGLCRSRG